MNKKWTPWGGAPLILFIVIGLLWTSQVFGAISVGIGIPFGFSYVDSNINVESSSGYSVSYQLPILIGFGFENIENKIADTDDTVISYSLINVFYTLPVPIIEVNPGVGFGSVSVSCSGCNEVFNDGVAYQGFIKAGYTFDVGMDLGLGLGVHYLSAHNEMIADDPTINTITTSNTSNYHYSLLISVGF